MTRTNKILLSVVALGAAIAAFYFFVLAPKREEVAKLDEDIAGQQAAVEQARLTLAGYEEAKKTYKRNYATLARLGKAVPTDDDVTSMMVQLEGTGCPGKRPPNFEIVIFFEGAEVPETVEDITVQPGAGAQPSSGGTTTSTDPSQQGQNGGVTTPPADPADTPAAGEGTATPASTPQGAGS